MGEDSSQLADANIIITVDTRAIYSHFATVSCVDDALAQLIIVAKHKLTQKIKLENNVTTIFNCAIALATCIQFIILIRMLACSV